MWEYSLAHFYINIVATLLALAAIVIGILHFKTLAKFRLLIFYSFLSFLQGLLALTVIHFDYNAERTGALIEHSLNIFLIVEFTIFYIILLKVIRKEMMRTAMKIVLVAFLVYVGFVWFTTQSFYQNPNQLTTLESFLILIPVLFYFFELFFFPPEKNLARDPTFWIISGMFLLFSTIIPLFLFKKSINQHFYDSYTMVYTINFVSYCLFFSCLLNALICQIRNLKSST